MNRKIQMLKDGQWIPYDGSDVNSLLITEKITMAELKARWPEKYKEMKKKKKKLKTYCPDCGKETTDYYENLGHPPYCDRCIYEITL